MKQSKLENILKAEGFIVYPIKGISMLPLLVQGEDAVRIELLNGEAKVNDVVLYKGINNYILHRVIGVNSKEYLIVGDNNNNLEHVKKSLVIGVMVGYFKKKRYVTVNDQEYLDYVNNHIINVDYKTRTKQYPSIPNEWKYIFGIIKEVIGEKTSHEVYDDLNWKEILNICKKHSVTAIVATKLDKDKCPESIYNEFNGIAAGNLRKTVMFDAERNRIIKQFENNGIDYVYLKGININKMYPRIGIREFADNDLLIKDKDSKLIYNMMINDGYEAAALRGVHDSYHKNPFYNFEFHRRLFDERKAFNGFFNNIWDKAISSKDDNHEYLLSEEDSYLYNLAHFYKHYTKGGAGIRSFIDMYLIKKRMNSINDIDYQYIEESLIKSKLDSFEKEILTLVNKMFVKDEELSYMDILYIMESGTYGLVQNDVTNELDKKNGSKFKYFLSRIFIPYRSMKLMYPCLFYLPFLLPIFWVVRLFRPLFNKASRNHLNCELSAMKEYKKKN